MTLNYIREHSSLSRDMGNLVYLFIAITFRSPLIWTGSSSQSQIDLFKNCWYSIVSCLKKALKTTAQKCLYERIMNVIS